MSKTLTLRLDDETYEIFASAAKAENRSITNLIQTAALRHLHERQFLDDAELVEIGAEADLQERICQGSRDARERHGRFVE